MARSADRDRARRAPGATRPHDRHKLCAFCADSASWVDYKNIPLLQRFVSDRGAIRASRATGTCARHQREVQIAVKTARELLLLPYARRAERDQTPGRGSRRANHPGETPSADELEMGTV